MTFANEDLNPKFVFFSPVTTGVTGREQLAEHVDHAIIALDGRAPVGGAVTLEKLNPASTRTAARGSLGERPRRLHLHLRLPRLQRERARPVRARRADGRQHRSVARTRRRSGAASSASRTRSCSKTSRAYAYLQCRR